MQRFFAEIEFNTKEGNLQLKLEHCEKETEVIEKVLDQLKTELDSDQRRLQDLESEVNKINKDPEEISAMFDYLYSRIDEGTGAVLASVNSVFDFDQLRREVEGAFNLPNIALLNRILDFQNLVV